MINTLQIRRYAFCAITCAVIAIGSFLATRSLHSQVFASATQLTPYTMKLTETITHVPTSRTVTGRVIFQAVATDGSKAEGDARSINEPGYFGVRTVQSISELKVITVDDVLRARTTRLMSKQEAALKSQGPKDPTCTTPNVGSGVKHSIKGEGSVLGFRTVIIELTYDDVIHTNWLAPDLNCAVVRLVEQRKSEDGTIRDRFERGATEIKVGDPDRNLFNIPSAYREMSPSQLRQESAAHQGLTLSQSALASIKRADDRYCESIRSAMREGRPVPDDMLRILTERNRE